MTPLAEQKRQLIEQWRAAGLEDAYLQAFAAVPREAFLPEELREEAYRDQPMPIGFDQTISQPSTILTMLRLLEVASPRKGTTKLSVLEIGAGSGYVCALLAELGCSVIGLDIIPELAVRAARTLRDLGCDRHVKIHASDGGGGWEEGAPYDRILISAAVPAVPKHLFSQLKARGLLVAPVGSVEQRMIVCRKEPPSAKATGGKKSGITEEDHGAYLFVPLRGKWGAEEEEGIPRLPFV